MTKEKNGGTKKLKNYDEYTMDELMRMNKKNTPYDVYERLVMEGLLKIAPDQEKEMREVIRDEEKAEKNHKLFNYNQGQSVKSAVAIISMYY